MNTFFYEIGRIWQIIWRWIVNAYRDVEAFWRTIPHILQIFIIVVVAVACINIVIGLIYAVVLNRKKWKQKPATELMYNTANGSGNYRRRLIYKEANRKLVDPKWSWVSFAGLASRIGGMERESKTILFLCSIPYIPLLILGICEMVIRFVVGIIVYFVLNLAFLILFFVLWLINLIIMPVFKIMDRSGRVEQHCPSCYATFKIPYYVCPYCATVHKELIPGTTGLLYARCSCGNLLPCSSFTHRERLSSICPACNYELAASNIKLMSVQVVGGNSSGKSAFISAFQHVYRRNVESVTSVSVEGSPQDAFSELETMYSSGCTEKSPTDSILTYNLVHRVRKDARDGIVIYDIPDEVIMSDQYEKNPINFGYADGIIMIIDPLSLDPVRKACIQSEGGDVIQGYSDDDTETLLIYFINKFSEICGRAARKTSNVPVAVLIAKSDIKTINEKIGSAAIKAEFDANRRSYRNYQDARNSVCRLYLDQIGLTNVLNNLDSVFEHVSFFPISAIGHVEEYGKPFKPIGVIEPIAWIADECMSSTYHYLKKAIKEEDKE